MTRMFVKTLCVGLLAAGCGGSPDLPQGYDSLAPVKEEDRVAAAARELEPKGPPTTCGVAFDLSKAGWFVAKGWGRPVGDVDYYQLYISVHEGGPYCKVEKPLKDTRLVLRGLDEDWTYYMILTSVQKDGTESRPSPEWSAAAVRREYHLSPSVPVYPEK